MHEFMYELGDTVSISISGEVGIVIGRSEYSHSEDAYFIRYKTADGRALDSWWGQSALQR